MGIGTIMKLGGGVIAAFLLILTFFGGFYTVNGGTTAVIPNTMTGQIDISRGPKFGLKMPFFTTVETFTDVSTITFGESSDQNTRNLQPIKISFADTYKSDIAMSSESLSPVATRNVRSRLTAASPVAPIVE